LRQQKCDDDTRRDQAEKNRLLLSVTVTDTHAVSQFHSCFVFEMGYNYVLQKLIKKVKLKFLAKCTH
jgi:hypothetical protein